VKRRDILRAGLALAGAAAWRISSAQAAALSRVRPGEPGWPSDDEWSALNRATSGRLSLVNPPNLDGAAAKKLLSNPFYIADQPGLTESSGWLDAWRSSPTSMW
jgi:hypothetical protein